MELCLPSSEENDFEPRILYAAKLIKRKCKVNQTSKESES